MTSISVNTGSTVARVARRRPDACAADLTLKVGVSLRRVRNPVPYLREYPSGTARALRAARNTGDRWLLVDAARMRRDSLLDRLGRSVRPRLFGRPITCSSVQALAFAFEDVVLSGHYAMDLGTAEPVIVDCGANIGLSILYFHRRYPGAKITAFEPVPTTFAHLARNTTGIAELRLECAAVGAADGEMQIWTEGDTMHAGAYQRAGVTQQLVVPVKRLSPYLHRTVDLLKLDVEGAESDVLAELHGSGALARVNAMVIEFHHHLGPHSLGEFLCMLDRAGFGYQLASGHVSALTPTDAVEDIHIYARRET